MRSPTILDIVQAVSEVAPSHPEVAVWWYARAGEGGAPRGQLVLEPRDGTPPDIARIGSEMAAQLQSTPIAVRLHRGASEGAPLYRVLTAGEARGDTRGDTRVSAGRAGGS
jgi:hypothetical protein